LRHLVERLRGVRVRAVIEPPVVDHLRP
jgi:hypothetical protein